MSDQVLLEYNSDGNLAGYTCAMVSSPGYILDAVEVPYYYDLVFPCGTNDDYYGKQLVETSLLTSTASLLRMLDADGGGCLVPPPGNAPWIARLQGDPKDVFETSFSCLKAELKQGECCAVVKGAITMYPIGAYQLDDLKGLLALQLEDNSFGDFRTLYLGAEVERTPESGRNAIAPAVSLPEDPYMYNPENNDGKSEITVVGGFVAGGLIAGVLGALLVVIQRRRRFLRQQKANDIIETNSDDGEVRVHVSVQAKECFEDAEDPDEPTLPFSVEDEVYAVPNYKFDLGDSFKNEITGMYGVGPSSMAVVAPYPMEETSDSEVDSWAQTDGTVGSLEEQLEEITAEI